MLDFAGKEFKNPFVVSSGPLTASIDLIKKAEKWGAAAVSIKLTFIKPPFKGKLRTFSVPGFGLITPIDKRLNEREGLELVRKAREETSLVLCANISAQGNQLEDWRKLARDFEKAGADIIEANFCCVNVGLTAHRLGKGLKRKLITGGLIGQVPELAKGITRTLKDVVKIPVVCKLMPTGQNLTEVALACEEGGADGISVVGGPSVGLPPLDVYQGAKPLYPLLNGASFGFISGPLIRYSTYKATAQLVRSVKIPVIASGGIRNWRDAVEMMMWGATLISATTSIMWYGFEIIRKINEGIKRFIEEQGYSSCEDFRGMALQYLTTSDGIELREGIAVVNQDKCDGCGKCLKPGHCNAVKLIRNKAYVDADKCLGCSICTSLCPKNAIKMVEL